MTGEYQGQSEGLGRRTGPGRHPVGRPHPRPRLPAGRQSRHRQDHHRASLPARRRRDGRKRPLHHPLRNRDRTARPARPRTAGTSTARSRSSNSCRPKACSTPDKQQSLLYSSDLELGETTKMIFEAIERVKPKRIVLDSLSEIRLLAQNSLRYRRQILALKHYFARNGATVLMLDDLTSEVADKTVHTRRPRRHPAGRTGAGLWRGAPPPARHEISRHEVPRRLARLRHHHRRRQSLPAPRRLRTPHRIQTHPDQRAASANSTPCSAAASNGGRACWCSGPPAPARARSSSSSSPPRSRAARRPPCSSSTKNSA